ncbi:MAG: stage II sporulation protein M [Chitinophagia bacterium]|nr:stage II sporulation protein M [Chitinophagia bacterium]
MREGQFIQRNLRRWESYQEETEDPDEIARRFTYLVDDLGYAKTFYPRSNTIRYVNSLAANIYLSIYRNKKVKSRRLITFWTEELPLIIFRNRRALLVATLIFTAFTLLGFVSAQFDQTIIRGILGDGYVSMTESNIASGKPFNVYNGENEFEMFVFIAANNIKVAFITYAAGMLAGGGTVYFLFQNGLMLGVFENLFFRHHLGLQSILVVFIHGTLEIWSIVVAGCAGLMLGGAILFPGTYSRVQSLRFAALDSVKLVVSLVPSFLLAAFFEGYVTRHTEMPLPLSLLILLGSATFIVWYYVIYPIKVHKRFAGNAS